LAYAIGKKQPLSINIKSNRGDESELLYKEMYNECAPSRMIKDLKMKSVDYEEAAKYGHFTK